ncbi:N-acetylglucosamine-6-phosphate deacetylase [Rhodococcus sp. Leaf278]|uniref:N-acetylglucosamine-6-phosphate deacetylase n=1 Tax=Rhodococcus sp. Leaf278 TaxID=1736319 RepID=UPI00070CDC1A|nr:amidohydrolase family protein [Rhodococcus sp. Leaf278]KQU53469.1 N-acetylglucosamine-6-phosphate deacetylase [Rhodococcus sp. Leaf278]
MTDSISTTLRGRVVTGEEVIEDGVLALAGDRISWVGPAQLWTGDAVPQSDSTILPGLVDVHCHGGAGASFPDSAAADLMTAVRHHRSRGTTTMLASLVSAPSERLIGQTSLLADLYESGDIAGVHVEGPFLSVARCGAQDPGSLRSGDTGLLADIIGAGRGAVRSMTLAPEVDGFAAVAQILRENDIVPSIGHTDADALTTRRGIEMLGGGPITATHLFNGMPTWHHRAPGPVSECLAAAARGGMVLELIGDGVHLADETVRAVFDLVGGTQIALVSDAMAAAGMVDGRYRLGPLDVTVQHSVARLSRGADPETAPIAGGTATVLDLVRRAVQDAGVPLVEAVRAGSSTPATTIGLGSDIGCLQPGMRADVLVVDGTFEPVQVIRGGIAIEEDS